MKFGLILLSLLLTAASAFSNPYSANELKYVKANEIDIMKYIPPVPNSPVDRADLQRVLERTRRATDEECKNARAQYNPSIKYVFGNQLRKQIKLSEQTIEDIDRFFSQNIFSQVDYFVYEVKERTNRPRPFLRNEEIHTHLLKCMSPHSASSYFSGHAALARAGARLLIDLYPAHKSLWDREAQQAGEYRVLAGLHHYSDVMDGAKFADELYNLMSRKANFQNDLRHFKSEIIR